MSVSATPAATPHEAGLRRVPTGVPGLDAVLCGGLVAGRAYTVHGAPGTGKTTLAHQICFAQARAGKRALFVTLLVEGHARMLQHLQTFSFFDPALVPAQVYLISGFQALEQEGLRGLLALLHSEIRARRPAVLVIDGLTTVREGADTDREIRKFLHELQVRLAAEDCVGLLLASGGQAGHQPEYAMVDGLLFLGTAGAGGQGRRELEVGKLRGSSALLGCHSYRITGDGLVVYPRIEALFAYPSQREGAAAAGKLSTGIPDLDAMMDGGLPAGTATLVLGASGTGTTAAGLHFLSRASGEEPGLYFGFHETPERLLGTGAAMGLGLAGLVRRGHLDIAWRPATEQILDDLGGHLLDAVRRRDVRRLFIDGLGGFMVAAGAAERLGPFLAALLNELRARGVTVVCSAETIELVGHDVTEPIRGLSVLVENLVLLRVVEGPTRPRRLLSVLKVRGSGFDPTSRELLITPQGARLAGGVADAAMIPGGLGMAPEDAPRPARRGKPRTAQGAMRRGG